MSNIEQVIEQVRSFAGGDFAFVLTRRGRLVTRGAPGNMPEVGRLRLVEVAEPLIGTDEIGEVTLPREQLVPFGGAAPVDVYVAVAAEKAIICVVMSTWAAKIRVTPAVKAGIVALLPLLGEEARPGPRRRKADAAPDLKASKLKRTTSGLLSVSGPTTHATRSLERAPKIKSGPPPLPAVARTGSMPAITVGEAVLGRESLLAIELEGGGAPRPPLSSIPAITVGEAVLGRESLLAIELEGGGLPRPPVTSAPAITVGEAALGRESLLAIDREMGAWARTRSAALPAITLGEPGKGAADPPPPSAPAQASPRATQPWMESASDAKRAADAARLGRQLAQPKVTIKLEEADEIVLEAAQLERALSHHGHHGHHGHQGHHGSRAGEPAAAGPRPVKRRK